MYFAFRDDLESLKAWKMLKNFNQISLIATKKINELKNPTD